MKNKPYIVLGLVALLVACLGVIVAYAYFTDEGKKTNDFIVGRNSIEIIEDFQPPSELIEGDNIFIKEVQVENTGNVDCYVRVFADFSDSTVKDSAYLSPAIMTEKPNEDNVSATSPPSPPPGSLESTEVSGFYPVYNNSSIVYIRAKDARDYKSVDKYIGGLKIDLYHIGKFVDDEFVWSEQFSELSLVMSSPFQEGTELITGQTLAYIGIHTLLNECIPDMTSYTSGDGGPALFTDLPCENDVYYLNTKPLKVGVTTYKTTEGYLYLHDDNSGADVTAYLPSITTLSSLDGEPVSFSNVLLVDNDGFWVKANEYPYYLNENEDKYNWYYIPLEDDTLLGGYYYYTKPLKPGEDTTHLFRSVDAYFENALGIQDFDIIVSAESVQSLDKNGNIFIDDDSGPAWKKCWQEFLDRK